MKTTLCQQKPRSILSLSYPKRVQDHLMARGLITGGNRKGQGDPSLWIESL